MKRFAWIVLIIAVAGGVGYGLFQEKYKRDRKFRKQADKQIASIRNFYKDLMSPVKPNTKLMDKIHAEKMENMITQNNANAMIKNRMSGPREDDRPRDEEGNVLDRAGTTIIEVVGE